MDLMRMVFKPELKGVGKKRSNGILATIFEKYDTDGNSELSPKELSAFFVDLSRNLLKNAHMSRSDKAVIERRIETFADSAAEAAFEEMDLDNSGGISVDELIPAIKSGTFPRIIASAMGLDPSKVKAREEGPVDPLLALTTAKLKGLKVPNTIPENLAAEDEAHERSTHVNAGALNASMAGSGSRFGSTVSRISRSWATRGTGTIVGWWRRRRRVPHVHRRRKRRRRCGRQHCER